MKYVMYVLIAIAGYVVGNYSQLYQRQHQEWVKELDRQRQLVVGIDLNPTAKTQEAGESAKPTPKKGMVATITKATVQHVGWEETEVVYARLRKYESDNGTAGWALKCKSRGMVNEVGYNVAGKFCFQNETDQHDTIVGWILDHHGLGYQPAMCHYNQGGKHGAIPTCAYFNYLLAVKI